MSPPVVRYTDTTLIEGSSLYYYWLRTGQRMPPQSAGANPKTYFSPFSPRVEGTSEPINIPNSLTGILTDGYSIRDELDNNAIAVLTDSLSQYRKSKSISETVEANYLELSAFLNTSSASVEVEQVARIAADLAIAGTVTSLSTTVDQNTANLSSEALARSDADSAITATVVSLRSEVEDPSTGLSAVAGDLSVVESRVGGTEAGLLLSSSRTDTIFAALDVPQGDTYSAFITYNKGDGVVLGGVPYVAIQDGLTGSAPPSTSWAEVPLVSAVIQTNNVARIGYCLDNSGNLTDAKNATICVAAGHTWSGDTSLAEAIKVLKVEKSDGTFAAIQTASSVTANEVGGLRGQYSVKLDINNRVVGFGFASSATTSASSEFVVVADKFSVVDPASTTDTPLVPFQIGFDDIDGRKKAYFGTDVVINGDLITTGTVAAGRLDVSGIITAGGIIVSGSNISSLTNNSGFIPGSSVNANVTSISGGSITTGTVSAARLDVSGIITAGGIIVSGSNISSLTNNSGFIPGSSVNANVTSISGGSITTGTVSAARLDVSALLQLEVLLYPVVTLALLLTTRGTCLPALI